MRQGLCGKRHGGLSPALCFARSAPEGFARVRFSTILASVFFALSCLFAEQVVALPASPTDFSGRLVCLQGADELSQRLDAAAVSTRGFCGGSIRLDESFEEEQSRVAAAAARAFPIDDSLAVFAGPACFEAGLTVSVGDTFGHVSGGASVEVVNRTGGVAESTIYPGWRPFPIMDNTVPASGYQFEVAKGVVEFVLVFVMNDVVGWNGTVSLEPDPTVFGNFLSVDRDNSVAALVDVALWGLTLVGISVAEQAPSVHRAHLDEMSFSLTAGDRAYGLSVRFDSFYRVGITPFFDSVVVGVTHTKFDSSSSTVDDRAWFLNTRRRFSERVSVDFAASPVELAESLTGMRPVAVQHIAVELLSSWHRNPPALVGNLKRSLTQSAQKV